MRMARLKLFLLVLSVLCLDLALAFVCCNPSAVVDHSARGCLRNAARDNSQRTGRHVGTAPSKSSVALLAAKSQSPVSTNTRSGGGERQELIGDRISADQIPQGRLVLFRDRNGWCPYSERVWLAMMEKGLDFDSVLINLQGGKPQWYSSVVPTSQTPAIRLADGRVVYDSARILEFLEEEFIERPLLPAEPKLIEEAQYMINSFSKIMPSGARPSSRGAFLFKGWGSTAISAEDFEESLSQIEDLLNRHEGPFFLGDSFSQVDCHWAPFLERWSFQVPGVRPGLYPRDAVARPALSRWYDAMEKEVPSYACRVKGTKQTWTLALAGAGGGATETSPADWINDGNMVEELCEGSLDASARSRIWAEYQKDRPWLAESPREELANIIEWQRAEAVAHDAAKKCGLGVDEQEIPMALLSVCVQLLRKVEDPSAANSKKVASELLAECGLQKHKKLCQKLAVHIGGRICTPRDMGAIPAFVLQQYLALLYAAAN